MVVSQDKQDHHCMVAPVELETSATGHEMSNQGEKPDLPQHKPRYPCKNWWLPTTSQLHFFVLHNLYLRPFYTMAAGSCAKIAILAQTLLAPNDQNSIEEQVLDLAMTSVIVAPVRLARLLWWLPRRAKQSLYALTDVELETNATGPEMSHQQ